MRLRLPQLLLVSVALVMLAPSVQAQDDNAPLGDVARKTKIATSKEKPKVTLNEDNTPVPAPVQAAAPAASSANASGGAHPAASPSGSAKIAPAPTLNACTDDCDAPAPGKTPIETAQNKVKFYSDEVAADQSAISDIQKQMPDEKDAGRLQGLKDSLEARSKALEADQKALDDAKAELSQAQSTYE